MRETCKFTLHKLNLGVRMREQLVDQILVAHLYRKHDFLYLSFKMHIEIVVFYADARPQFDPSASSDFWRFNSSSVFPLASFHSVHPFELRASTTLDAPLGDLKSTSFWNK